MQRKFVLRYQKSRELDNHIDYQQKQCLFFQLQNQKGMPYNYLLDLQCTKHKSSDIFHKSPPQHHNNHLHKGIENLQLYYQICLLLLLSTKDTNSHQVHYNSSTSNGMGYMFQYLQFQKILKIENLYLL